MLDLQDTNINNEQYQNNRLWTAGGLTKHLMVVEMVVVYVINCEHR